MELILNFLGAIGAAVLGFCGTVGRISIFAASGVSHIFRPPFYGRELWQQILQIGFFSLPVVGLTALFTGAALALQIYSGGSRFNAESVVPSIVAIGMVRELGPVLGGLMVAGRVSSSIAADNDEYWSLSVKAIGGALKHANSHCENDDDRGWCDNNINST